jgi:hypothetical protein
MEPFTRQKNTVMGSICYISNTHSFEVHRVQGSRIQGSRIQGLGFRVSRVQGCRAQGSGSSVKYTIQATLSHLKLRVLGQV